jgi:hypothetical protein
MAKGIFAADSEAEKIIKYFEKWVTDTLSITVSIELCILKPGTHHHSLLVRGLITIMLFTRVAKDCLLIIRVVHERMGIRQKEGYSYHPHLMILRRVYLKFGGTNYTWFFWMDRSIVVCYE